VLEALLFASGQSVELKDMAKVLELSTAQCRALADSLMASYDQHKNGMAIKRLETRYEMTSREDYYDSIRKLYQAKQEVTLTPTQLEVLAIVCYKQPVTRQEVSDIRGVASDGVISRLVQLGLVEEAGRVKAPGRPILLRTSDEFLRCFGIAETSELPAFPKEKKEAAEAAQAVPAEE